tara:strand:+ start:40 stop:153 length:114 start_codon:yes stop_codon:yes gene_type:complete
MLLLQEAVEEEIEMEVVEVLVDIGHPFLAKALEVEVL